MSESLVGLPVAVSERILNKVVIISALGYFVDIYDLILFSVVRRASLIGIGVPETELLDVGVMLLNWQMAGMLLGGVLWGVLGDKRGRVAVLFGSILLYSLANIANAFVTDVTTYAVLRFLAGVGLAGELGAAITLVSEVMSKETRGYGTAIVASVGILGGLVAVFVSRAFTWQMAYLVGGGLGLLLLVARFTMIDSLMFEKTKTSTIPRGALFMLFSSRERFGRYAHTLLVGLPIWFVVGILITFSPELGIAMGATAPIDAGIAVLWTYVGLSLGDLGSGFLSGWIRSRKWIFVGFLAFTSLLVFVTTLWRGITPNGYYTLAFFLGLGIGYWAVFNTNAAEQFGTNLRATVATTAPNFVRGMVVPVTLTFGLVARYVSLPMAALIVGQATILLALWSVTRLAETYGKDLDYVEVPTGSPRPDRLPMDEPVPQVH